eukprot:scaffold3074_cov108-Cylindrotheca_fusiformis.AAC.7
MAYKVRATGGSRLTLTRAWVASSVIEIPDNASRHCLALEQVQMSGKLARIGKAAFPFLEQAEVYSVRFRKLSRDFDRS